MELILSPLVAAPVVSGTGDLKGKAQNLGKPSRAALSRFPPVKMNGGVDEKRVCLPPVLPVVNPAGNASAPASPPAVPVALFSTPVPLPAARPADQETPTLVVDAVPAKPLRQAAPRYPRRARAVRREGAVTVGFEVDATGAVRHPQATGDAAEVAWFGAAACDAVAGWTFAPARRAGRPVTCQVQVLVRFSLDR